VLSPSRRLRLIVKPSLVSCVPVVLSAGLFISYYNRAICQVNKGDACSAIDDLSTMITVLTNLPNGFGSCGQLHGGIVSGIIGLQSDGENGMQSSLKCGTKATLARAYAHRGLLWGTIPNYDNALEDLSAAIAFGQCTANLGQVYAERANLFSEK
jgi:hypothetical protein